MSINLLKEFKDQGYDLRKLKKYKKFLEECVGKDYSGMGTHKHHILPTFMQGSNKKANLIVLSYKDHIEAHLILGESFPKGSKENWGNIASTTKIFSYAKFVYKKIYGIEIDINIEDTLWPESRINVTEYLSNAAKERWKNPEFRKVILDSFTSERRTFLSERMQGENNHMFGNTHTSEARKKISEAHKGKYFGTPEQLKAQSLLMKNNNLFGGKHHTDESKQKISESSIKMWKEKQKPLIEGVFECDVIIDGKQKHYYRKCPDCPTLLYSSKRSEIQINQRNGTRCKPCSAIEAGKHQRGRIVSEETRAKLRGPRKYSPLVGKRDKSGSKNTNAKTIQHIESGQVFYTMKSAMDWKNVTYDGFQKLLGSEFKILGKTNVRSK